MKVYRLVFFFLLAVTLLTVSLSFLLPVKQTIERSVAINSSVAIVYQQIVQLKKFNSWSVWGREDSTTANILTGNDGEPGTTLSWKGNPQISGEGRITILATTTNKSIIQQFEFLAPQKGSALSTFDLSEQKDITTVFWKFEKATPRPGNIFNLLYNFDKEMGADFEDGLARLKKIAEEKNVAPMAISFLRTQ